MPEPTSAPLYVERLFVGGQHDGQRHQVIASRTIVHVNQTPRIIEGPGFGYTLEQLTDIYLRTVAPTGEIVFRLEGLTEWDECFDVEAWVARRFPDHTGWRKLGPWLWAGDSDDEKRATCVMPHRLYIQAEPTFRHRITQRVAKELIRDAEFDFDAEIARQLRQEMDFQLLPACPVTGCENKIQSKLQVTDGVITIAGRALRRGQTIEVCPLHAHEVVTDIHRGLRVALIVPDRP